MVGECINRKKFTHTTSIILTWFQPLATDGIQRLPHRHGDRLLFDPYSQKTTRIQTFGHQTVSTIPVPLPVTPQDSLTNSLLPTHFDPNITSINKHSVALLSWERRNLVSNNGNVN